MQIKTEHLQEYASSYTKPQVLIKSHIPTENLLLGFCLFRDTTDILFYHSWPVEWLLATYIVNISMLYRGKSGLPNPHNQGRSLIKST